MYGTVEALLVILVIILVLGSNSSLVELVTLLHSRIRSGKPKAPAKSKSSP